MKEFCTEKPETVSVYTLRDGTVDIILRRNIKKADDSEDMSMNDMYECDMKVIRNHSSVTADEVFEKFDAYWNEDEDAVSDADRLDAIEAAIIELAEVIANG